MPRHTHKRRRKATDPVSVEAIRRIVALEHRVEDLERREVERDIEYVELMARVSDMRAQLASRRGFRRWLARSFRGPN